MTIEHDKEREAFEAWKRDIKVPSTVQMSGWAWVAWEARAALSKPATTVSEDELTEFIKGFFEMTMVGPDTGFKPLELARVIIKHMEGK